MSSLLVLSYENFREFLDKMCRCDGMVDVADSKSAGGDSVWVRVPPPAPSSETLDTSAFEASSVSFFIYALSTKRFSFSPTRSIHFALFFHSSLRSSLHNPLSNACADAWFNDNNIAHLRC